MSGQTEIVEGRQRLVFDDRWWAEKYDDHPVYRSHVEKIKGEVDGKVESTKAADVVGISRGERVYVLLLEAKDLRGHTIENKDRINGELAVEVALKVRDTLAGLIAAPWLTTDPAPWREMVQRIAAAPTARSVLTVACLIELDNALIANKQKAHLQNIRAKIKEKLSWLNPSIALVSSLDSSELPGLTIHNLPAKPAGSP